MAKVNVALVTTRVVFVKARFKWRAGADLYREVTIETPRHRRLIEAKAVPAPDGYKYLGAKNTDGEWIW